MAQKYDESDGVWRTIGGRRVFIKNGQSLSEAMIQSGKFKNLRSDYKKAKAEENKSAKDLDDELREKEDKYLSSDKGRSKQEKEEKEIKELHDKLKEKAKAEGIDTEKTNWRDEIKAKAEAEKTETYPRAEGGTKFEDLGLEVSDKKAFSDYLRDKYGTDDFRVINFDNKEGAKKIYDEYASQREKTEDAKSTNDDFKSDRLKYVQDKDKEMLETYNKAKDSGFNNETATKVALKDAQNKSNETMNKASKSSTIKVKNGNNVIPRDFKHGFGKFKIKTNANSSVDDKFSVYKDEYDGWHMRNLETGEVYQTSLSTLRNNEIFEFDTSNTMNDKIRESANKQKGGFYTRKDGTKEYDPYKGTPYEKKYDSVKEATEDPNSAINQYIKTQTEKKAYKKYMKEHPYSKITLEEFLNKRKK